MVAWQAAGTGRGAFEHALAYATRRQQLGRPIAGFQLVQDLLARMLANTTASLTMCARLAELAQAGEMREEQVPLAKMYCTTAIRETVGWAREVFGGNGVLLEHHVTSYTNDAEAIYSFVGTREINSLIVSRGPHGNLRLRVTRLGWTALPSASCSAHTMSHSQ